MGDLRESLDSAIDELDAGEALEETQQEIVTDDEPAEPPVAEAEEGAGDETAAVPESIALPSAKDGDKGAAATPTPNDSLKAPVDWSPKERESWSKVPRELQERILARERDMAQTMEGTRHARAVYDAMDKMAQSYAPTMAALGTQNPLEAVQTLFHTATVLNSGSPQQKAAEVARLINQFGVDVVTLDNALVGNNSAPAQNPQSAQIEQLLEQKLAPVNQYMQQVQQMQQYQQSQQQQAANQSVMAFAQDHEFLGDVREAMADIIEMAAQRGVNLSLEDAYNRACAAHPEISQVMEQRRQQEQLLGQQNTLQQKKNAAASLSGRMVGSGGADQNLSLRDQITAAWESAGS